MNRLTSRKFLATMFALTSASVLCWFGHIDAGVYSAVMLGVSGGYFAANVVQKNVEAKP